ncbi:TetR/AcrR family transcriptional regulator [Isoptericola jiangsuensis]|uniref:TetR/AcrR family transcriptional regulator n=1 Tax=Isoptericola jiangsuensis TaxID=548579 RepID=UPI003AACB3BB
MPRVSDEHREARRRQIREAALRAFAAKGYQYASIADVVAESGLSAGAIYTHFSGKQELFAAVAEEVLSRRGAEIDAASRHGLPPSPGEVLTILAGGMSRDLVDGRLLLQLWAESTVDPEIHDVVERVVGSFRRVLREALQAWFAARPDLAPDGAEVAAERLLPVMMALGQGFQLQRAMLDEFDGEEYLAAARAVLPA